MFIVVKNDNTSIKCYALEMHNYSIECKAIDGIIELNICEIKSIILCSNLKANILTSI